MSAALGILTVGFSSQSHANDVQSQQWYLDSMRAEEMWEVSTGEGVKVAVIDTGVNPDAPSLKGKVLVDEVPASVSYGATKDYDGHGTSMAELIVGSGSGGLKGLAPGARVIPIRADLEDLKEKTEKEKTASVGEGIRAAADTDVKIINLSVGSEFTYNELEEAVDYAVRKGKLLFGAIGNAGNNVKGNDYPGAYLEVVGISAADKTGKVGKFSQQGDFVDLASPGVNVPTWCDENFARYCQGGGTSQATAIASASAALVWAAHPDWTANQVLRTLIDTAGRDWKKEEGRSVFFGNGLIRPRKVLENPNIDPGPPDINPITKRKDGRTSLSDWVDPDPEPSKTESGKPTQDPAKDANEPKSEPTKPTAAVPDDEGVNVLAILGGVAGVAVLGAGVFVLLRKRRNA
ncbi:S8 family serine peptidase [Streptomyces sp. NPDC002490]|uniref:S8 family serine peptidase n=1 Tax=Streptomyces sp. NPDC002490 TaxID=3154416 RepID=UPI003322D612